MELKVFELKSAETDWFCGHSLLTALANYCADTGIDICDFDATDEIREVPKDEWKSIKVIMNDCESYEPEFIYLDEYMKGVSNPSIICSTAY